VRGDNIGFTARPNNALQFLYSSHILRGLENFNDCSWHD
jgi:hypothetical protein